eukprot:CAMPEP_0171749960 /NCGR_PEP_ID=MMETSP0991-20121206/41098_1 /TAXON_ID=483369 /ORGANISM="non described non described, Strain CCMP2098" /LENGTH=228 /DNA_ID=CAMNT_0012350785 /DNA_START=62 /DNA_END=749 /DNA_ORIENTATION=+
MTATGKSTHHRTGILNNLAAVKFSGGHDFFAMSDSVSVRGLLVCKNSMDGDPTDARTELLALQYTEEEVDAISPDIAKVVVERGLPRPASGMPPTWSRSAATKKRHMGRKKAGRGGGRLISRVVRALNPVPLVAKTVTIPARILGALFQSTEMRAVLTQAVTSGLVVAGLVFFRRQNPLEPQQKATPPTSRFQNRPMMPRFATFGRKRKQGVANVDEDQYEDEEEPLF